MYHAKYVKILILSTITISLVYNTFRVYPKTNTINQNMTVIRHKNYFEHYDGNLNSTINA